MRHKGAAEALRYAEQRYRGVTSPAAERIRRNSSPAFDDAIDPVTQT